MGTTENSQGSPTSTRREFGLGAGAAILSAPLANSVLNSLTAEASPSNERLNQTSELRWADLLGRLDQLPAAAEDKEIMRDHILDLKEYASVYWDWLNAGIDLVSKGKNQPDSLYSFYEKVLGKTGVSSPEDLSPFSVQKGILIDSYFDAYYPVVIALEVSKLEGEEAGAQRLKEAADKLREKSREREELEKKREGGIEKKVGNLTIIAEGGGTFNDEQRRQFDQVSEGVVSWYKEFPYFSVLFSRVIISSESLFGVPISLPEPAAGGFQAVRDERAHVFFGEIRVDIDRSNERVPEFFRIAIFHETGHAMDPDRNSALLHILPADEAHQMLTAREKALAHPDWGEKSDSIPKLFAKLPRNRKNPQFYTEAKNRKLSYEEFMGLISQYPTDELLTNAGKIDEEGNRVSLFDMVARKDKKEDEAIKLTSKPAEPREFKTLDEFLNYHMDDFEKAAQAGNNRAKVLVWGLKNFRNEFNNFETLMGDEKYIPKSGQQTSENWLEYCNFILTNATIFHGFMNDIADIKNQFTANQQNLLIERSIFLRLRYRDELFAEGLAYSHHFWDQLDENPYKEYWKYADMVLKKIAGVYTPERIDDQKETIEDFADSASDLRSVGDNSQQANRFALAA